MQPSRLYYIDEHIRPKYSSSFVPICTSLADPWSIYDLESCNHFPSRLLYRFQVRPRCNLFQRDAAPRPREIRPRLSSTKTG